MVYRKKLRLRLSATFALVAVYFYTSHFVLPMKSLTFRSIKLGIGTTVFLLPFAQNILARFLIPLGSTFQSAFLAVSLIPFAFPTILLAFVEVA